MKYVEDVDGKRVPAPKTCAPRDSYVVCRGPVYEIYSAFVSDWNLHHEPDSGRYAANSTRTSTSQVRAVEWLANETRRIDHRRRGIPEKSLNDLFRKTPEGGLRYPTLDLRTADLLLTAMDKPDLIARDPRLQPQRRSSRVCCNGSLPDSLTGGFSF